jgi:hypothetical protein
MPFRTPVFKTGAIPFCHLSASLNARVTRRRRILSRRIFLFKGRFYNLPGAALKASIRIAMPLTAIEQGMLPQEEETIV